MNPPAPEVGGKVTLSPLLKLVTAELKNGIGLGDVAARVGEADVLPARDYPTRRR